MQLIEVIPLINIPRPNPQRFTYYYSYPIPTFSLVEVEIGKKTYPALVISSKDIKRHKAFIRKAIFQLKPVKRVISTASLFDWQFKLAKWIADYYWSSLGTVLKKFVPSYLVKTKKHVVYRLSKKERKYQALILLPDTSFFEGEKFKKLQEIDREPSFIPITSEVTTKKQFQNFKKISSGKITKIIGTRASLFAPFNNLKEIHIYEEADKNHKSWDQKPKYNAVDVAQKLAALTKAKLFYYSTLPSLELFYKKVPFTIFADRQGLKPRITVIDLTKEKPNTPFSENVLSILKANYLKGKQAILYINRRGEASFLLCRDCGFVPSCPWCELPFTYHSKGEKKLLCHHCSSSSLPPTLCPKCNSHQIRYYGFGTQRVENELTKFFPKAKVFRLDSDIVRNDSQKKAISGRFGLLGNFLVTTSMIFQTPFKPVDTVINLSADMEMNLPDFAAYENLFFNLWRLQSFARRELVMQTYNPANHLFTFLETHDWKSFYQEELIARKALKYPPFSSLIKLTYAHPDEDKTTKEATLLAKRLKQQIVNCQLSHSAQGGMVKRPINCQLLGPAPAFLYKLKGKYRYQILLKITKSLPLSIRNRLIEIIPPQWDVDVDPIGLL